MTNLVGSPLQAGFLRDEHTQSGAPCQARIKRVVAAHNRLNWEHLRGQPITGQAPCAPKNPCGQLGHDHSGAGFGAPMKGPIWWWTGRNHDDPSEVFGGTSFWVKQSAANPAGTLYTTVEVPVPPCYPGGCFEELRADVGVYVWQAAASSNLLVNLSLGEGEGRGAISISTATTGYKSGNANLSVIPGVLNQLRIRAKIDISASVNVNVVSIALSQAT